MGTPLTEYQILYWRDLPAQIRVYQNGRPISHKLPERFQEEIDRVAMVEGLANTDAYLKQWAWSEKMTRNGAPAEVAEEVVRELDATQS
ncbi:MAG: virulence factor [Candidatus Latescibacterota bacterium]|nr:virulence factor [Candidatus Latescibacterota bacterium]